MKTRIYITALMIGLVALMILPDTSAAAKEFTDVTKKNEHYEGIYWLVDKDAIDGRLDGTFRPDSKLKRMHAAKIFADILKLKRPDKSEVEKYFTDVKANHEYADSIAAVRKEKKIFNGDNEGKFHPNKELNREQMASIIVQAYDLEPNGAHVDIKLSNVSPVHKANVQILADLEITDALEEFNPGNAITRGQFASFLYRTDQKLTEEPEPDPEPTTKIVKQKYDHDFKTMVDKQMAFENYKQTMPQTDLTGSWFDAGRKVVEYYINPNNFKQDSVAFYQFLRLSESSGLKAGELNQILPKKDNILTNEGSSFAKASKKYRVDEVYLISHALLETGNGKSKLATGIPVGKNKDGEPVMVTVKNKKDLTDIKTTHNMYGIGAVDACPTKCGSENAYAKGWFTPEKAIVGGAEFVREKYINRGQDTLYKMRWNPDIPATHQYATDVGWANKQASRMKDFYGKFNLSHNISLTFEVPSFKNQPASSKKPTGADVFHLGIKNKGETAFVIKTNALNFRSMPIIKEETVIGQLKEGTKAEIVGANKNWYKIDVKGKQGWVSADYLHIGDQMPKTASLAQQSESSVIDQNTVIGEIMTDSLGLKAAPENSAKTLIEDNKAGSKIIILDEKEGWFKVQINDETGWMDSDEISITNVMILNKEADVKQEPDGESIGKLSKNENVIIIPDEQFELTTDGKWLKIFYEGQSAWISEDVLK